MATHYPTPSSQLIGGPPQQSYGTIPEPTDPFLDFLLPLSPEPPSLELPFEPTTQKKPSKVSKGLVFWLVIVFLQVALIAYRSNTLAKFINLESSVFGASRERSALVAERKKSEREREKMRHDRELWEPEDQVPQGAYWKPIWPAYGCRAYGEREYWGMLLDIPEGWSAMDACMNTPAEVKGVNIRRPHRCAFVDGSPHIHGYWMVDWDQGDCKPWHKDIRDTGCTNHGSGLTRIEAKVEGILHRKDQDWRVMCESTPFTWDGVNYTSPLRCEERGLGGSTKVAMWEVPADRCR